MEFQCIVCEKEYTETDEHVEYLKRVRMTHPFIVCSNCKVLELSSLSKELANLLISGIGTVEGRGKIIDFVMEKDRGPTVDEFKAIASGELVVEFTKWKDTKLENADEEYPIESRLFTKRVWYPTE